MLASAALEQLRRGKMLVAEARPTASDRTSWIGVYPLDLANPSTIAFVRRSGVDIFPSHGVGFHVRSFEVAKRLIEDDVWVGEPDLLNSRSDVVFSEAELIAALERLGCSLEQLELPFKTKYPI
jgi:hypothetical protein